MIDSKDTAPWKRKQRKNKFRWGDVVRHIDELLPMGAYEYIYWFHKPMQIGFLFGMPVLTVLRAISQRVIRKAELNHDTNQKELETKCPD